MSVLAAFKSATTDRLGMVLDSLENVMSGLGGPEDAATGARPSLRGRLTIEELDKLYLQSDLARRIVEEVVDDVIRQGWDVFDADKETANEPIEDPDHLNVARVVRKAVYNSRLYGGGAVAMMYSGAGKYDTPLPEDAGAPESLLALDIYECQPSRWDEDPMSPTFGEPSHYWISPNNNVGGALQGSPEFHRSRLLLFFGASLPSRIEHINDDWGDSILQSCWEPIRNFEQSEAAIANIVQRFEIATYSIAGLADLLENETGREKIRRRMQLLQQTVSMVRAVVVDKDAGEEYTRAFSSVNGLDTLWDRLAHSVAKAARMPMTQLFGMSPSGLATDDQSGRANWRKQIASMQEDLRPALRQFYELVHGSPVVIKFRPQDEQTATEEANIMKTRAEAREKYTLMGAVSAEEFRPYLVDEGVIQQEDLGADLIGDPLDAEEARIPGESEDAVPVESGEDPEDAEEPVGPGSD